MQNFEWMMTTLTAIVSLLLTMVTLWQRTKIIAVCSTVWRKTFGRAHAQIFQHLNEQGELISMMADEIKPNGNGSIHQQLHRIAERQEDTIALQGAKMNADHQAMFVTDVNGKVIANNRSHQMLTGFNIEQLMGDGWVNVIHPDDRQLVHDKWKEAVEEEREFSETIRYVTPNGRSYNVRVEVYKQLDSNHKIRGYLGVVHPENDTNLLCHPRISGQL